MPSKMEVTPPHELLDTAQAAYTGPVTGWMGWNMDTPYTTMTNRALRFCESTGSTTLFCCFCKLQGCVKGAQDHAVLQK